MELKKIIYIPKARVEFTEEEVMALIEASEHHYDHKCKELSQPGGILYGIRNMLKDGKAEVALRFSELDVLAKTAEVLSYMPHMKRELVARFWFGANSFHCI